MHSALTPAQRLRHWLLAHLGEADLVLGTRLAVFASLPRLGLIVVDEEHDPSYKQQEGARYSARDLAVYRGRLEHVPVVLGSATPSLESWQRARQGRYQRLALDHRIGGGALPRVRVFDMGPLPRASGQPPPALAPPLLAGAARSARARASKAWCSSTGAAMRRCCIASLAAGRATARTAARGACSTSSIARCAATTAASSERVPRACPSCGNLDIAADRPRHRTPGRAAGAGAARGPHRAHRRRHHARQGRARRRAGRGACRRRGHPGRHADGGQGPRLPAHHAGGRGEPRQRAVLERLSRRRAPASRC